MEEMLSIGEIGKIVDISTDTLRYYDEIGLMRPSYIDKHTKYRYYSHAQVLELLNIIELKRYGFQLDVIRKMLNEGNGSAMKLLYAAKLAELMEKRKEIERAISGLKRKMKIMERNDMEGGTMKKTALIIDDLDFIRKSLKSILERDGFEVVGQAANGKIGVEKFMELKPQLVTLDITMPIMDGFDVLAEIRRLDPTAESKVVMCTSYWQPNVILKSLAEGANGYVVKPFQEEYLLEVLEKAFDPDASFQMETVKALQCDEKILANIRRGVLIDNELVSKLLELCRGGRDYGEIDFL